MSDEETWVKPTIYDEIRAERERKLIARGADREYWYGPNDWIVLIVKEIGDAAFGGGGREVLLPAVFKRVMISVAELAVAAIETMHRQHDQEEHRRMMAKVLRDVQWKPGQPR